LFHLDWWHGWGFRGEDEEILAQDLTPPLYEVHDNIIQSLKEAFYFPQSSDTGESFLLSFLSYAFLEVGVEALRALLSSAYQHRRTPVVESFRFFTEKHNIALLRSTTC
jgi:hypothetical protein